MSQTFAKMAVYKPLLPAFVTIDYTYYCLLLAEDSFSKSFVVK